MLSRHTHNDLVWIDAQSPTPDEVKMLVEEFNIHPRAAEELTIKTLRPKVDVYENFIYLILHFPKISSAQGLEREQEIDFIIGKNFLITAHYGLIDTIYELSKIFDVHSILKKPNVEKHAGYIFFHIMRDLYKMLDDELDHAARHFNKIEPQVFGGNEHSMVRALSSLNRDLIHFKQTLRPHKEVLGSFEFAGTKFFGEEFSHSLRTIIGEYYEVSATLNAQHETLIELRNTNDSLLATKTNDIMKTLTITTFIMLPITFITGLFSMSVQNTPLINHPQAFWIIIGTMFTVGACIYSYFRFIKKWM